MNDPVALQLPDETWLTILTQHELDYTNLKCLSRVCKRLNTLVKDSSLDALLFRAPPATPIKKGASVEVHPLLEDTFMTIIGSDDAPLVSFRTDKEFNAHKLHCTEEFATSPATECLIIDMAKGLKLKKATGVTVKHVLGAVGKMWEEAVPEYMVDEFLNDCRNKEGVVTWGAAYCERNGWTGWETPRVRKDGEVTIHHNHFDS